MIVKQHKTDKYEHFQNRLITRAQQNPFAASFNAALKVDKKEYILKLRPDNKHKMVSLQASEVEHDDACGRLHMPITDSQILSSLLELLIWQGVA